MPLTMAGTGETNIIKKVGGTGETRRFLENLEESRRLLLSLWNATGYCECERVTGCHKQGYGQ